MVDIISDDNLESSKLNNDKKTNETTDIKIINDDIVTSTTSNDIANNNLESVGSSSTDNNETSKSISSDSDSNSDSVVNCLSLTVRKDYSLSIVKNVVLRTLKDTWRVAVSFFTLNFLKFFL